MDSLDNLLERANAAHGHLCAGQVLGVRMAIYACQRLGIDDPTGLDRKRLITFVEIDRCATDAIGVVTGCRLGKRALKFRDWGKMAATFCDLHTERALRVVALEGSRERARQLFPELPKAEQQMRAYRTLSDAELFSSQWVRVALSETELPGYKNSERILCARCSEGISFDRYVERNGLKLCIPCAEPEQSYWQPFEDHTGH